MADQERGTLAVACVVDSSLTLAAEWSRILAEYVSPLLKRLSEVYPDYQYKYQIRLGFVTYATAATRPTPLLVRRFFSPLQPFTKELRDAVTNLDIGCTGDGGSCGMAVLEGLVAAVEMFDDLRLCLSKDVGQSSAIETFLAASPIFHIFHIAASPPDDSQCPLWNRNSLFDDVTWETLPSELKKRDIHLSLINLREFSKLSELHSSLTMGSSQQPWFNVRAPHRILLSGFTLQQRAIKRSTEKSNSEKVPDYKRLRPQQSPSKTSPAINNSGASPPSVSATNVVAASFDPQQSSYVQKLHTGSQILPKNVLERLRILDLQLQRLEEQIKNATAMGDIQAADHWKAERDKQRAGYAKFRAAVASFAQNHARTMVAGPQDAGIGIGRASVAQTAATQVPPSVIPHSPHTRQDQQQHPLGRDNPIQARDAQSHAQLPANRTSSSTFLSLPNANQNSVSALQISPSVSLQMVPQVQKSPGQQHNRQTPSQGVEQPAGTSQVPENPKPTSGKVVWQGVLAWTGFDATTQGRKEVHCQVLATFQNGTEAHSETWPPSLMLIPSREPAVSLQDLQSWVRRFKPALCAFQADPRSSDTKTNLNHYRSLIQLLTAKKMYAVAGWSLPPGGHENRVLVFPVNPHVLVGAFYPLTGIPEYPKSSGGTLTLPAAVTAQLQKLHPEQRQQVFGQIMLRRQQQLQLQRQQQQAALFASGAQPLLDTAPQPPVPAASALQSTTGTTMQSGIGSSMPYEIVQSFMQRNVEGGEPG